MNNLSKVTTSIVRDRGQLTIPDSIRRRVHWINTSAVVNIHFSEPDLIVISPHRKHINWDTLWNSISFSRSFKGKVKNVSQRITEDREGR